MNKKNFDLALKKESKKMHIKRQKQLAKAYHYHKFFHKMIYYESIMFKKVNKFIYG